MPAAAVSCALSLALLAPLPASAQTPATITLSASATKVAFGESVTLSGTLSPAEGGETLELRDGAGTVVATMTADAGGVFTAAIAPEGTDTYVAATADATS